MTIVEALTLLPTIHVRGCCLMLYNRNFYSFPIYDSHLSYLSCDCYLSFDNFEDTSKFRRKKIFTSNLKGSRFIHFMFLTLREIKFFVERQLIGRRASDLENNRILARQYRWNLWEIIKSIITRGNFYNKFPRSIIRIDGAKPSHLWYDKLIWIIWLRTAFLILY